VARLSSRDYDELERAIVEGRRLSIYRRGTEYLVIPSRLTVRGGREAVEAVHPTTGESMVFVLDEIDGFEVVR